ncbi:E3 Sumo-Protein Ligase Zbed1 [Manis pentadactyla]|nr:E3 Sumo-Protein Ligase Zbed1 [Manis pentadactyla]
MANPTSECRLFAFTFTEETIPLYCQEQKFPCHLTDLREDKVSFWGGTKIQCQRLGLPPAREAVGSSCLYMRRCPD